MTKKARMINKLTALSLDERKDLIVFFTANPVFENRIDWNNRSLKHEDFDTVFSLSRTSRKNRKNTVKMFEGYHCKIIFHTKEFVIVVPLDWHCAIFLNSLNCGGEGAKWCIGNKHTDKPWEHYMKSDNVFYFIYFFERHPIFGKKLMVKIDEQRNGSFFTQRDGAHAFDLLANYLRDRICSNKLKEEKCQTAINLQTSREIS